MFDEIAAANGKPKLLLTTVQIKEETLSVLRELRAVLEKRTEPVLAEADDANFFRQQKRRAVVPSAVAKPTPSSAPVAIVAPPSQPAALSAQPPLAPQSVISTPLTQPAIETSPPAPKLAPTSTPLPMPATLQMSALRSILMKVAPMLQILNDVPNDALAKKMATRWKTKNQIAPITVLGFQELTEQKELLAEIAKALDVHFGPARLVEAEGIESEKQWETFLSASELKLVIVCDSTLWQLPSLRSFYREIPASGKRLLREKPLFLLPDLSLYLKDAELKRSLWKALCRSLPSSSTTI